MPTLDDLRDDIDRVDEVLVRLLNERARVACEIGRLKKELGVEVYQPEREKQVLAHVRGIAAEGRSAPTRSRGCSSGSSTKRGGSSGG
jgi:chorismate mutase